MAASVKKRTSAKTTSVSLNVAQLCHGSLDVSNDDVARTTAEPTDTEIAAKVVREWLVASGVPSLADAEDLVALPSCRGPATPLLQCH